VPDAKAATAPIKRPLPPSIPPQAVKTAVTAVKSEALAAPQTIGMAAEPKNAPVPVEAMKPIKPPEKMVLKVTEKPAIKANDKAVEKIVDKVLATTAEAKPTAIIATTAPEQNTLQSNDPTPLDTQAVLARSGLTTKPAPEATAANEATKANAVSKESEENAIDTDNEAKAVAPAPKPEAKITPPAATTSAPSANNKAMRRVQLASSTDRVAAEKKMLDMVASHATLLRQNKLMLTEAAIAGRGTFYRIQTQAMPAADAAALCKKLQGAGLSCLLVAGGQ
jgi:hypothetical protein